MPRYRPVAMPYIVPASLSVLDSMKWKLEKMFVDFTFGEQGAVLRVSFSQVVNFRLLDKFPVASEDEGPVEGIKRDHLLYRVEDTGYLALNRDLSDSGMKLEHFRFLTPAACVDVIAGSQPTFNVLRAVA
ncbi:hypothetical protein EV128_116151 [Rhizobium azibense]|nr:hypothetical protein EV128_116151 [Rhizobium azibense]